EAWQQPNWIIGLAGAIPAIAVLIALPILPRLVARLGAVAAIAGGCLAGAVGFLALYAFPLPWAWIGIRLLMSAGFALPWLAGETWINTVAREETRGRVIAIYAIAFFSGFSAGPIILQTLGLSGFWPFLVGAAGTAIAGVPILLARRLAPEFCRDGISAGSDGRCLHRWICRDQQSLAHSERGARGRPVSGFSSMAVEHDDG